MSEERKTEILREAFAQFSDKGVSNTKIDDIALSLKISKKTLYFLFKSKFELVEEACHWKLNDISEKAQQVVDLDTTLVNKLIKYLEIILENVTDISVKMTEEVLMDKERVMNIVNEYLKGAVYSRFARLIDQGKEEGIIKCNADSETALVIYWETLSSFLFARPTRHIPDEFKLTKPIYQLLGDQMVNFFRGLLNEQGTKEFDRQLQSHPQLSKLFA